MHYACRNGFLPELRYLYKYERRFYLGECKTDSQSHHSRARTVRLNK